MKDNKFTRILWISDIHFRGEYNSNTSEYIGNLAPFLKSFLDSVKEQNENHTIGTVILTGDLAFSGSEADYIALDKLLIAPLREILGTKTKFVAIPGNHDVERKGVEAIFDKVRNTKEALEVAFKDYINKAKLLKDYEKNYIKLFENYTNYLKIANINTDLIGSRIGNRLFGYLVDDNTKTIYFLFNTAWFCLSGSIKSIGNDSISNLLEGTSITSEVERTELKNKIEKFIELYAYTNENGGQLIGSNLIDDSEDLLNKIISLEYHEYTKITLLHHPFSWLSWEEMYSFGNKSFLRTIVKNSDIILTGHEHVPEYIVPSLIFDHSWHISAGMFLNDNIKSTKSLTDNFPHNRFSLLDIFDNGVKEAKFLYEPVKATWNYSLTKYLPFHRSYKYIFSDTELLNNKVSSFVENSDFVIKFFETNKEVKLEVTKPSQHDSENDMYVIDAYQEVDRNNYWIVVRPKVDFYYQKELPEFDQNYKHHLDEKITYLIKKAAGKSVYIAFLSLDLLVFPQIYNVDTNQSHENVREDLFGKITQEADLHFDRYRHHFFNRSVGIPFDKISSLNFVNIIVPYWKLGK